MYSLCNNSHPDECYFQEEMNKGSSQESKRAKENFPIKMLNPQDDARDGLKETTEQKIKGTYFVRYSKKKNTIYHYY